MQIILMFLLTTATLAAALYAHYRTPYHTPTPQSRWFVHIFLGLLGLAFGWVTSQLYPVSGLMKALIFLCSFGIVHVPAAAILFIKRQQKRQ